MLMMMIGETASLSSNPFAALTAVVAPAVLTNACSVLALGTSNRLARVVDRTRAVTAQLNALQQESAPDQQWHEQLDSLRVRTRVLLQALRAIYAALGLFAATALLSVIGSLLAFSELPLAFHLVTLVALAAGILAVLALVSACVGMVRETRIAVQSLAAEANLAEAHYHPPAASGPGAAGAASPGKAGSQSQ